MKTQGAVSFSNIHGEVELLFHPDSMTLINIDKKTCKSKTMQSSFFVVLLKSLAGKYNVECVDLLKDKCNWQIYSVVAAHVLIL